MKGKIAAALRKSETKRVLFSWSLIVAAALSLGVCAVLLLFRQDAGSAVVQRGNPSNMLDEMKMLLDAYTTLINLTTAFFAAVAFLVTAQQKHANGMPRRSVVTLGIGIVFLAAALVLACIGREDLLIMMARNAFDPSFPLLSIVRWMCYFCLTSAAILVASFAVDVAVEFQR